MYVEIEAMLNHIVLAWRDLGVKQMQKFQIFA